MVAPIARVVAHARGHKGVITTQEAGTLGVSERTLQRRAAEGLLVRVRKGVYALPGILNNQRALLAAAATTLNAVVSHQSAAELLGFSSIQTGLAIVSVPLRRTNRFPGVTVHQLTDLADEHVREVGGLPTTVPARTAIDLSAVLSRKRLERAIEHALAGRILHLESLQDMFTALGRRGKPGTKNLREVLKRLGSKEGFAASDLESLFLELIDRAGLVVPEAQFHAPWLKHRNGRIDFAYRNAQLVIELDSRRWHMTTEAFQNDRERDNLAQLAGWRILRFTYHDVTQRPHYVISTIKEALGTRAV